MTSLKAIYRYTFSYRGQAILTIIYNLLFVIFSLLSLVLFIPFRQMIFKTEDAVKALERPVYDGGFQGTIDYLSELYQYKMQQFIQHDPKTALLFVCLSVLVAFFLKNLFRYGAIWHQSQLRMSVVRDLKNKL